DGEIRWLEAFGRVVPDDTGQPRRLTGVCMDITERKMAEEALLSSERRFKALAGQAPVGIFETDVLGNCLFVNERWRALAGMTDNGPLGQGWIEALLQDDRDRVCQEWHEAARSGGGFASEYRFV